jgi:MFS family permease
MEKAYKVYKYRWVVLVAYMFLAIVIQVQWLTHAPIARAAEVFYAGQFNPDSLFNIDFIAMSYMLVFLLMCIPASYIIDTFGIKTGLGIGAFMTAIFSLLKGFYGSDFTIVLIAQIGLAAAQPFIINAVTAVTARWFPLRERGMAAGFAALAQYLGIITAMAITPLLVVNTPELAGYGNGIDTMLLWYGIITAVISVAAFILIREKPPTSPSVTEYTHTSFFEGFKYIFKNRSMVITLLLFFIGLGLFNTVSSMVDSIAGFVGVVDSDGLIGVLMLVGGVIGAVVIPILSDKLRKRKIFLVICIVGMLPGIAGLTFAGAITSGPSAAYTVALISSFILGFFVMSAGPIGFQYAAEVSYPAPESSSQGMLLFAGQITGLIFTAAMSIRDNMYLKTVMNIFVVLALAAAVLVLFLKESQMIITEDDEIREEAGKSDSF